MVDLCLTCKHCAIGSGKIVTIVKSPTSEEYVPIFCRCEPEHMLDRVKNNGICLWHKPKYEETK